MDRELETWVDSIIDNQKLRNGIFAKKSWTSWFKNLTFGSQSK